jgi:hypothetical protein
MVDTSFINDIENFLSEGGELDDFLDAMGIKKSTYYSWRSRGIPRSRIDEVAEFFGNYSSIEWGENVDLSEYLKDEIIDGDFLNVRPENLPNIFTPRGHLWFGGIGHIRVIGGPDDGKEFDEIYQRTTGNSFNYPSEAVESLSSIITKLFAPKGNPKGGSGQFKLEYISTEEGEYFDADDEPFFADGFLIWNTDYSDINPNKGRGETWEKE